jgi:hypothetical protein
MYNFTAVSQSKNKKKETKGREMVIKHHENGKAKGGYNFVAM